MNDGDLFRAMLDGILLVGASLTVLACGFFLLILAIGEAIAWAKYQSRAAKRRHAADIEDAKILGEIDALKRFTKDLKDLNDSRSSYRQIEVRR